MIHAVLRAVSRLVNAALITLVRGYRLLLSPWMGSSCRFTPTCSQYALQALQRHGPVAGSALSAWRVVRCHPGCVGGHDPVPAQRPRLFSWLSFFTSSERPHS